MTIGGRPQSSVSFALSTFGFVVVVAVTVAAGLSEDTFSGGIGGNVCGL